ncbi:glyoxalase [Subtercola boreus]|uniref:Glyoxalase n=1 Tax=Subtercola boreus TaxID=120213 RepID=A0A3E0VR03_9MICO|nr:VOC family protein [Subtercola boreus]RFA11297.1 glyoxalase [Subtercola boreus]
MVAFISHTTVDCTDAYALSTWWKVTLGYTDLDDDPNGLGDEECMIRDPKTGHLLLFVETPDAAEAKQRSGKNRIHFDLRPATSSQEQEVEALVARGASVVGDLRGKYGPGTGWVVLADPEGNEFCVLRSEAERAATV